MANNFRAASSRQPARRPAFSANDYDEGQPDTRSLDIAIREAAPRWRGQRNEKTIIGQGEIAIKDLKAHYAASLRGKQIAAAPVLRVCDVSTKMLKSVVFAWLAKGLGSASCHRRLSALSAMGITVSGCRPPLPKGLKWWLTPDVQMDLTARLRAGTLGRDHADGDDDGNLQGDGVSPQANVLRGGLCVTREETPPITLYVGSFKFQQTIEAPPIKERIDNPTDIILADFIDWTVWTGLRVEEFPPPSPLIIRERLPQRHRSRDKDPRKSGHPAHILRRYRPCQAHLRRPRRFLRRRRDVPRMLSPVEGAVASRDEDHGD